MSDVETGAVSPSPTVVVAVVTYGRPRELARLLAALEPVATRAVHAHAAARVDVLVVDNDPDRSARTVASAAGARVTWVHEPEAGVAAARNRALDGGHGHDLLAFIDDDETPADSEWLTRLLACRRDLHAHVVAGPVVTVVEGELDPWLEAGEFFARGHRVGLSTGAVIERAATNNLLLDMGFVREAGVRFDPRFGRSGGEDSLFTSQLHAAGARMVWCAEAIVHDHLLEERQSRAHALARMRGMASTGVRVRIVLAPDRGHRVRARARASLVGVLRVVSGAARAAAGAVGRSTRLNAKGRRDMMRGIGGLEGAAGRAHVQYGQPQGGTS